MFEDHAEIIGTAIAGSALSGMLARAFIAKGIKDLEDAISKICEMKTELATITIRLDNLDKSHRLLQNLDRKIIALESKVYGAKSARSVSAETDHDL